MSQKYQRDQKSKRSTEIKIKIELKMDWSMILLIHTLVWNIIYSFFISVFLLQHSYVLIAYLNYKVLKFFPHQIRVFVRFSPSLREVSPWKFFPVSPTCGGNSGSLPCQPWLKVIMKKKSFVLIAYNIYIYILYIMWKNYAHNLNEFGFH